MKQVYLFNNEDPDSESPKWWQNFVMDCEYPVDEDNIDSFLAPHKAKFKKMGAFRMVEFESEGDHTMFVLRFS